MKPMRKSAYITTILLCSLVLLSSGCTKTTLAPPDSSPARGSEISGGNNINYPSADYTDTRVPTDEPIETGLETGLTAGLAAEEPMDSTGGPNSGNLSINSGADEQSEEYRRTHGRSSTLFSPIYFDFDQAGISLGMNPIISANATYMKENLGVMIVIEGNCDERGTNEYNLALAERRAINAKEYMINLGVNSARIRTVSYGEERPLFTGRDELDWSLNRRADFIAE